MPKKMPKLRHWKQKEAVQGVFDDEEEEEKAQRARTKRGGKGEEKASEGEEKKEAGEKEGPEEFETRTFPLASPMFSKKAK
jgi:hypothetical protein